ncbi:uncharacterized protein LOC131147835 isoform X2 [Malania oleifera]|uniref:uncharacterized protein LOC131147835 isoform X2 n=1 Tax=Malania oleifera TaxID=397392 RepID=UPI0025ADB9C9|nr:uncharacterized protein LOC131147835 isoform X2 [Malania oleifera]
MTEKKGRIKRIMQADEDVGKIAMAVPLLVSKALELFLQDLCDQTYEITLQRGVKTLTSLHLKQCIQSFNVFDFLREIVSKVPDLSGYDAVGEDRSIVKRRKVAGDEENENDDESKRGRMHETGQTTGGGRARGRGRGRGRVRGSRILEKYEDDPDISVRNGAEHNQSTGGLDNLAKTGGSREIILSGNVVDTQVRNFDLNVDLDDNGETTAAPAAAPAGSSLKPTPETKHEERPAWSLPDMESMAIDPIQLANLDRGINDDEDYDEEW